MFKAAITSYCRGRTTDDTLRPAEPPLHARFHRRGWRLRRYWRARTIQLAIGTVALVFTLSYFRSTWRTARTDRSELLALGTLCAISLLPIYHRVYDATILTIALAWILSELNGANWRFALTMLVPLTIFVIPFDVVGSAAKRVEFIAQISQTDWWQSVLAPHYAWGLFAGTAFLLGALGRQAAMNRGDHRAFTGPTADVFANG